MDLPGARIDRLKENLARANGVEVALVQADVLLEPVMALREHKLPESFSAVLIDVPCSNTGVMRHRADVKWRLQEGDFKKHPKQQLALLHAAARLVAPGGRLPGRWALQTRSEGAEFAVGDGARRGGGVSAAAELSDASARDGESFSAGERLQERERFCAETTGDFTGQGQRRG
eukprot:gene35501-58467_t